MRTNRVELQVPARPEMLFMTRMTAAAVASCTGMGYDRVEDLRLALDELCLTLMEQHPDPDRLAVEFVWEDHTIFVSATIRGDEPSSTVNRLRPVTTLNGFSRRILDAIVDEHGVEARNGVARSWFRMSGCEGLQ
jgi:hypothetical protein